MGQLVLDSNLQSALSQLKVRTELRSGSGELLGIFTPAAELCCGFDLVEAEKTLERERGQGMTTEEVLRYLQSLEKSP